MHWRVLKYQTFSPKENMAIDEAILDAHLRGKVPPTLRFYGWSPSAVSYGYNQTLPEETCKRIEAEGLEVVRRPTGGRAVLHRGEFTYSFVGSAATKECEDGFLSASITMAYRQICQGLQEGLRLLGVETELGQAQTSYRQNQDCFLATTGADLHYGGKKLIGSAQLRRRQAVLQHGSLLLNQSQTLMPRLLSGDSAAELESVERHANLFDIIPPCSPEDIQDAMIAGFSSAFGIAFEEGELDTGELDPATCPSR